MCCIQVQNSLENEHNQKSGQHLFFSIFYIVYNLKFKRLSRVGFCVAVTYRIFSWMMELSSHSEGIYFFVCFC